MTYFDHFDLPTTFLLDEADLKRKFYAKSKEYHPDFYTLESEEKQAEILRLSSLNNEAFKTLSDFDARMKYILELKGALAEEGKNEIPQDFLMEVMELNEALMELEFDFEQEQYDKTLAAIEDMEKELYESIRPTLEQYDGSDAQQELLEAVKDYYLKKRYLLRIRENLGKFSR